MTLENYALTGAGASITYSSQNPSYPATNLIDGNDTSYYQTAVAMTGEWFKIDLGLQVSVEQMDVGFRFNANYWPNTYRLEFSQDDINWDLAGQWSRQDQYETRLFGPYAARYWRFTVISGPANVLHQFYCKLWGELPVAPPTPSLGGAVSYYIQWLYDYAYQAAADKLEELDPGWTFSPVETFLLAGQATIVAMMAEMQAGSGPSLEDIEAAIDAAHVTTRLVIDEATTGILEGEVLSLQTLASTLTTMQTQEATDKQDVLDAVYSRGSDVMVDAEGRHTLIMENIDATEAAIRGGDSRTLTDAVNAVTHPTTGAIRVINDNTNAVETSINGNVDAAESAILGAISPVQADTDALQTDLAAVAGVVADVLEAISNLVLPSGGGLRWPGSDSVTLSTPQVITQPATLSLSCHGCIVEVLTAPSGQSVQHADSATRYKGIAWAAFQSDRGDWEALQQINLSRQVLLSKDLSQAAAVAVYCKPGAQLRVTPFSINPA